MGKHKSKTQNTASGKEKSTHSGSGASIKLGKVTQTLSTMSRTDFMKVAGIAMGSMGFATVGMSSVAQAQGLPPQCQGPSVPDYISQPPVYIQPLDPNYNGPAYVFSTLAALVDTFLPGPAGLPILVLDQNFQSIPDPNNPPYYVVIMTNLGSTGTQTLGSPGYIPLGAPNEPGEVPPSYPFLYLFLPNLAFDPQPGSEGEAKMVNLLIYSLDMFAKQIIQNPAALFKDLDYDTRYQIIYLMDKPDLILQAFIQKLIDQGCDPNLATQIALQQTAQAKQLITQTLFMNYFLYMSEFCNIVPDPQTHEYKRNDDNSWNLIPGGPWDQIGYPGPLFKVPSYTTEYEGLKVTIADGKVKFIQ